MLSFPLPPVPDPSLRLTNLSYSLARQLCAFLDTEDHCQILLDRLPALAVDRNGLNGEKLLRILQQLNGSVEDLDYMLEQSSLLEPLYLLRHQIPVMIIQEPVAEAIVHGQQRVAIDFQINPDAFPLPSFQWFSMTRESGPLVPLDGQTSRTLTIPTFQISDIGCYICHVTQQCRDGSFQTTQTRLTTLKMANSPPIITSQPERNVQAFVHDRVELKCSAEGFPPPSFQWSKGEDELPGETEAVLLISCASLHDSGRYSCLISNPEGSVVTIEALVTVEDFKPLRITHQPSFPNDAPYRLGSTIYLECGASGPEPICFQWVCNGEDLTGENYPALRWKAQPMGQNTTLKFHCRVWNEASDQVVESDTAATSIDMSATAEQHKATMKMALLIGNWDYRNVEGLEKVRSDVKTLHDLLDRMEFDVVSLCNLSKREIQVAVDQLCQLVIPGAYVVIYFAGHGIFYQRDYVMPVDVPKDADYALDDLVGVNEMVHRIQLREPKLLLFLLDTCRRIPDRDLHRRDNGQFPDPYGWMEVNSLDTRRNSVFGYATSENRGAYEVKRDRNGFFMTYLKREIKSPKILVTSALENLKMRFGQEIPDAIGDQIPQVSSTLAEPLSLHDPWDRNYIGGTAWNESYVTIHSNWRTLPSRPGGWVETFHWNGSPMKVSVEFSRLDDCFLNALKIELNLMDSQDRIPGLQPTVRPACLDVLKVEQEPRRCTVVIHKLQALMMNEEGDDDEEAVVSFTLAGSSDPAIITIHLGRPLISNTRRGAHHHHEPLNQF